MMKRSTKVSLIVSAVLIILGAAIVAAAFNAAGWEFQKFSSSRYITTEQLITDDFSRINIDIDTTDITFFPSEDGNCRIVCYEEEKQPLSVSVKDDTLWVKVQDERRWYDHIGVFTEAPELTVYLPKDKYEALYVRGSTGDVSISYKFNFGEADIETDTGKISCEGINCEGKFRLCVTTGDASLKNVKCGSFTSAGSTGDLQMENFVADESIDITRSTGKISCTDTNCDGEFSLRVTTGDAELSRIKCGSFTSTGNTGDLQMDNLTAADTINIERSTGDLNFTSCDGGEVYILTDTGRVKGSFASEKIFFAESDTGDIDVPKSTSGGICEIKTDTGDIKITIE